MLDGIRNNAQSWGVKLAFGIIIVVFVFWGIGSYQSPSGIVATVNGENITVKEFQVAYAQIDQRVRESMPGVTQEILDQLNLEQQALQTLVMEKVMTAEAKRAGVEVSPYDLRRAVEQMPYFLNEQGKFDKDLYIKTLENAGQNPADFEARIGKDLLPQILARQLTSGIWVSPRSARSLYDYQMQQRKADYILFPYDAAAQKVNDDELQKAYDERAASFAMPPRIRLETITFDPAALADLGAISDEAVEKAYKERLASFTVPERMKASHILIRLDENAPQAQADEALQKITALEKRIRGGESFADVAKEASQDGSAQNGGDLGWFEHKQMVPAFADAAFALNPGDISAPVRSQFGYHLIKAEEKEAQHVKTLEEVKDSLRQTLATEEASKGLQDKVDTVLATILGGADMKSTAEKAALELKDSGLLTADDVAATFSMRPADVQILMNTPAGTVVDAPVITGNGLSIIRIAELKPQMTRPLAEVKEELVQALSEEKARTAALETAQKARTAFANNEAPADSDIKSTDFMTREAAFADLGYDAALLNDLFSSDDKTWKTKPYALDNAAVLVRLADTKAASEEDYKKIEADLINSMTQSQANLAFQAFLFQLQKDAKVEIRMPSLFEKKNAQ